MFRGLKEICILTPLQLNGGATTEYSDLFSIICRKLNNLLVKSNMLQTEWTFLGCGIWLYELILRNSSWCILANRTAPDRCPVWLYFLSWRGIDPVFIREEFSCEKTPLWYIFQIMFILDYFSYSFISSHSLLLFEFDFYGKSAGLCWICHLTTPY